MSNKTFFKQIGGAHYKTMRIQPSHFINENNLPFAEGNAIKYICRHKLKGKKEDILKAIHYLEMIIDRDYNNVQRKKKNDISYGIVNLYVYTFLFNYDTINDV